MLSVLSSNTGPLTGGCQKIKIQDVFSKEKAKVIF